MPNSTFRRKVDSHPYALFKNRLLKPIFRKLKFAKQISLLPKKGSPFSAAHSAKKRPEERFCFDLVRYSPKLENGLKIAYNEKFSPPAASKPKRKKFDKPY